MRIAALLACLALATAACSSGKDGGSPVEGLITDVRVSGAGELVGISLRTDEGERHDFAIELEPDAIVSAEHLREHMQRRWPVRVAFRDSRDGPVAYRIDDAGAAPGGG